VTDPQPILDTIESFRRSKALFAAVELGIFDGERPQGAAVDRLLEACAALGFLERRGGQYINTALADEYLRSASPRTLSGYVRFTNTLLFPMWTYLEEAVLEGTPRWRQTFGLAGIRRLAAELRRRWRRRGSGHGGTRDFVAAMHGLGLITSPRVVEAFDLSRFRRLVDLGGSSGHLALAFLDRYPPARAAVFDLPDVAALAREYCGGRVQAIAGDFFRHPLPAADLYALGQVLHNLGEAKIRALLARIHAALPPGGALLVAERLLDDDRLGPVSVHLHSLNMLVATGGRERTLSEYRAVLQQAGFAQVEGRKTGTLLDAILAVKAE
jgi:acetylserotonin N-methyltransferase